MYHACCDSPLGTLFLESDGVALTGLWMDGQRYFPETQPREDGFADDLPLFGWVKSWLSAYFKGGNPTVDFPLSFSGTAFRREVWRALCGIPYGEVVTYGELAAQLAGERGVPKVSARAVGQAVGRNPISIIVPCHRVVGASLRLTGYAGGIERKRLLLELEGTVL